MSTWTGALQVIASKSKAENNLKNEWVSHVPPVSPHSTVSAAQEFLVSAKICRL